MLSRHTCLVYFALGTEIPSFENKTFSLFMWTTFLLPTQCLALTRGKKSLISVRSFLPQFLYSYFYNKIVNDVKPQTLVNLESLVSCGAALLPWSVYRTQWAGPPARCPRPPGLCSDVRPPHPHCSGSCFDVILAWRREEGRTDTRTV